MDAAIAARGEKMNSKELCIPAYLNQSIVFDLLAIIEDGFSNIKSIKSSNSTSSSNNIGVEAEADSQLGIKNIFSLLSIGVKGKYDRSSDAEKGKEEYFEKVHTPVSLFWKLRDYLIINSLLQNIDVIKPETIIKVGTFVEFEGIFHKNPIVESMENIVKLVDLISVLSPESLKTEQQNPGGGKNQKYKPVKKPEIIEQMEAFSNALVLEDSIDFVSTNTSNTNMVVTCDRNYFINRNINKIVDGKYSVVGKVVNYFPTSEGSISLLRTTSLSKFKSDFLKQMFSGFATMGESGLALPELITEIKGPCVQIIPIGIFI